MTNIMKHTFNINMKANILFDILKKIIFMDGELLRFAIPETQRAYS